MRADGCVPCMQLDLGNYAWALGKGFAELAVRACPASEEDKETTTARYVAARPQRQRVRGCLARPHSLMSCIAISPCALLDASPAAAVVHTALPVSAGRRPDS